MAVRVDLVPGEAGWPTAKPLFDVVYPPEVLRTWAGRDVTWAQPTQRVLGVDSSGLVVSHVGLHVREAEWDGLPVTIGGIGGVVTHPHFRRQGHARAALRRALTALHDDAKVAFALLFTEEATVLFYANQHWQRFVGQVSVQQPGGAKAFTGFLPMTLGIRQAAATRGKLDLRGLPW
jgi:GNAT superfamily N-acetyltransferase